MRTRLNSEAETIDYAMEYARSVKPGYVIALAGDLGAGKSVFARAMMRALGVKDEAMPSPTFSLIQEYEGQGCRVAHMDWYRLESPEEIEMLGVREYFQPPWICLIEWPERAPHLLPDAAIEVLLECVDDDPDARWVHINGRTDPTAKPLVR
jgi:tRNA threonylcarbamoyladenosine biosynthesis protein TsaE